MVYDIFFLRETASQGFLKEEVPIHWIPLSLKSSWPYIYFKVAKHFRSFIISNNNYFREGLRDKFTKWVKVIDKILFHVPAVIKVVIAIETSIDIKFEVTLIPTLWNVNVSDYLLLFKVVFIQIFTKIMILDLNLIYS